MLANTDTITALKTTLEQDPYNLKAVKTLAGVYFNHQAYLESANVWERLITYEKNYAPDVLLQFENAAMQNPYNKEILKALIKIHLAEGHIPEVLEEINNYLDFDGKDQQIISLVMKLSHNVKDNDILLPVLEKTTSLNMENFSLLEILAGIYLNDNKHAQAIILYEQCITANEQNGTVWNILADLYLQHGHYPKSANAFCRVMDLSNDINSVIQKLESVCSEVKEPVPFLYILADAYNKQRKIDPVIAQYQRILDLSPDQADPLIDKLKDLLKTYLDYPEANFVLSRALVIKKSYTEAVGILNKIVRLSPVFVDRVVDGLYEILQIIPDQIMAIQSLSEIFLYKGDYDKTLDFYNKLLDLVPDQAESIVEKAKKILKINPQIIKAREIIAKSMLAHKQYRKAITEAEAIIAIDQNNSGAYIILGRAQLLLHEISLAINNFKTALNLDLYSKEIHSLFEQSSFLKLDKTIMELSRQVEKNLWKYSLRHELGMAFFHRGLINEAISEFQVAVKDASFAEQVHRMQGICYKELGRYDLAVQQFQKAFETIDQNDIENKLKLQFYTGLAYEAEGKHQEALLVYEEIMTQDINYENIQIRMQKLKSFSWVEIRGKALAAIIADDDKKRIICSWAKNNESEEYNKKHKNRNIDMSFSMEHNNKAVEHILKGRFKAAEEELALAEQMDPKFTIAYNNKGVLALISGSYDEAQICFEKALAINNKISIVHANIGVLFHIKGEKQKALECYEKSLALDNSMFTTHINMGDVYYEMNDVQKAVVYWDKVLELGVVPELAKRRLKYKQP